MNILPHKIFPSIKIKIKTLKRISIFTHFYHFDNKFLTWRSIKYVICIYLCIHTKCVHTPVCVFSINFLLYWVCIVHETYLYFSPGDFPSHNINKYEKNKTPLNRTINWLGFIFCWCLLLAAIILVMLGAGRVVWDCLKCVGFCFCIVLLHFVINCIDFLLQIHSNMK